MIRYWARYARSLNGVSLLLLAVLPAVCAAQAASPSGMPGTQLASADTDFTQLSLKDLLNIEVSSVSKRNELLSTSAAAVFVLTGEEIRQAGVHSIAEALRLVPGLDVAQLSGNSYAISARGFNGTTADKLLVLLDGRSVYTPLFSGVFWDTLDTDLNDIDRIEVIRGPGAALWGANAVNGVINIITRSARDTQGTSLQISGGNLEPVYGAARSGFSFGDSGAARIYAQAYARDHSPLASGASATDGADQAQLGFRSDWVLPRGQTLAVSGDGYIGREDTSNSLGLAADTRVSGGNVLARWSGGTGQGSGWSLQAYFDNSARDIPTIYAETRNTFDVQFQQSGTLGNRHAIIYGLGYRNSHDDTAGPSSAVILFDPPRRALQSVSAFVQDQIALGSAVELTLGSKLEQDTAGGFNIQPSIRLGWRLADQAFTWAAVSRAVRTPNRLDQDIAIYCPPPDGFPGTCAPGIFRIGNPQLKSEQLLAYEWGLRLWGSRDYSFDLATFYNDYSDLRSTEARPPFESFANKVKAHSAGGELSARWQPLQQHLDLRAFYDLIEVHAQTDSGSTDTTTVPSLEGSDPRHQFGLQIAARPTPRWQAQVELRYVDKLRALQVPDYAELGARLAYSPFTNLNVALIGQNLLHSGHVEFGSAVSRAELRRSCLLELRWDLH